MFAVIFNQMAEKAEELALPSAIIMRILKDAVSSATSLLNQFFKVEH